MGYLYLAISKFCAAAKMAAMKNCGDSKDPTTAAVKVNTVRSAIILIVSVIVFTASRSATADGLWIAVLSGASNAINMLSWIVCATAVSLCVVETFVMIGSVVVPLALSPLLYAGETVSVMQWLGAGLILAAVALFCVGRGAKFSRKGIVWLAVCALSSAGVNISSKLYAVRVGSEYAAFLNLVSFGMYGVVYRYDYLYRGERSTPKIGFVGESSLLTAKSKMFTLSLNNVGGTDLASGISIYPKNLDRKANVLKYLDAWNGDDPVTVNGNVIEKADRNKIIYTDNLSLIMDMIGEFVNIVTIALVSFTALSLVVSSVMIGIITYVSVVERTKEIGVIRSLGGRKCDVSRLFIAETSMIGLASGLIGVGFTYFASVIINAIVGPLTGISQIALLPWHEAVIMIGVSVILTLISGVFPARAAARKDPVVALRTE